MKDPIIQIKHGEKIVFECTLWQLILNHVYEGNIRLATGEDVRILLNFEDVKPPEDMEL